MGPVRSLACEGITIFIWVERSKLNKTILGCLTEQHLLLFGTVIQWFARYELLMQEVMATVIGSDAASVMILTRDLDFNGKRLTLLDLLRHREIPLDQYDKISAYLMIPYTLAPLRDEISHCAWIASQHPNSIQPDWILRLPTRIQSLHYDPNAPRDHFIECYQDKIAYSLDDLKEVVEKLAAGHERFSEYLREVGLIRK